MEDVNGKILYQGYGLKLISAARSRGSFICKTDKGYKELKKNNMDENTLFFENSAKKHLSEKGFNHITVFNKTLNNSPFYTFDGSKYVLEDYVASQSIDLNDNKALLEATKTMAKMHVASCGFSSDIENSNIGKLPILYEKRNSELVKIKKWINNQSTLSNVDLIVLKNFDYYKDKITEAIGLLSKSNYNNLMNKANISKCFCHNAYKGENVRIADTGNIFVTGFSKCAYDYCIVDLAEFIRRYLKNPECEISVIFQIMEEYNSYKEITKEDKELIFAMLTYPYKFLKLCNEYYNRRKVYVSDTMVDKLQKCVYQSEHTDEILKQLKSN